MNHRIKALSFLDYEMYHQYQCGAVDYFFLADEQFCEKEYHTALAHVVEYHRMCNDLLCRSSLN